MTTIRVDNLVISYLSFTEPKFVEWVFCSAHRKITLLAEKICLYASIQTPKRARILEYG